MKIVLTTIFYFVLLSYGSFSQTSFSWNCVADTTLNCGVNCFTLKAKIPDIRSSTSSYVVNSMSAGGCFRPYVSPGTPGTATSLTIDDRYSSVINLPYSFSFFGTIYNQLLASTNGYICWDIVNAGNFSHYAILNNGGSLSPTAGTGQDLPSALYDKALIMGPYHDLDPSSITNPPATMQIKYDVVGITPHRKWILSFNTVPLYLTACNSLNQNTHQIVLYESLGVVEVFLNSVQQCSGWNLGHSMVGMQDFNRTSGIMAPGRAASSNPWGTINMNEAWRFTPASGLTKYQKTELFDLSGTLVSVGDTTSIGNNTFSVSFPNVCPPNAPALTTYVIKTTYGTITGNAETVISTDTVRVTRGSALSATTTTVAASCANNNIGSITVNASGSNGPFEYSINNGTTWQSSNVFNRPAGTYTILYRVVNTTCTNSIQATIATGPGSIGASYVITNVKCNGGNDGTVTVNPSGGTAPYQYSSNGGTTFQLGNVFTLSAGTYTIVVKDANNCSNTGTAIVGQPTVVSATVIPVNATCSFTPNGTITVNATGGTTPYTYSVNGINFQAGNVFTVNPGSYTVTVKDSNNCIKTFNTIVGLTDNMTLTTRLDTTICQNASVLLNTNANPGTLFLWSPGTGLSSTTIASPLASPAVTTIYQVTATLGQCTRQGSVKITVIPIPVVNAGPDVSIVSGDETQLNGSLFNAFSYLWSPPTGLNNVNILNPVARPAITTLYRLTATNSVGCSAYDEVLVTVIPYCIKVKNAFTPNGDGYNDKWQVYDQYDCLKNIMVTIYNRYGNKVYESQDYRNTWDGTYNGKALPDATYYAVIDFLLINGRRFQVKTDVTILR